MEQEAAEERRKGNPTSWGIRSTAYWVRIIRIRSNGIVIETTIHLPVIIPIRVPNILDNLCQLLRKAWIFFFVNHILGQSRPGLLAWDSDWDYDSSACNNPQYVRQSVSVLEKGLDFPLC